MALHYAHCELPGHDPAHEVGACTFVRMAQGPNYGELTGVCREHLRTLETEQDNYGTLLEVRK